MELPQGVQEVGALKEHHGLYRAGDGAQKRPGVEPPDRRGPACSSHHSSFVAPDCLSYRRTDIAWAGFMPREV